jgi:Arc/MetJ-type ribon-helix-helix transcriptional regulator
MAVKLSIYLTDEQYSFLKSFVEMGWFLNVGAVLQEGLDLLRGQIDSETFDRAALTEILRQRRSGVFISGEKLDMRLVNMLLTKQKK